MSSVVKNLKLLSYLIYFLLPIIILTPFLYFWWPEAHDFLPPHEILSNYGGLKALTNWQHLLGFFVDSLPSALLCWALILILRLLQLLKQGMWFDKKCEQICYSFSRVMLAFVVMQVVHRTLLVLVITATAPEGERQLMVSLSSDEIFALIPVLFAVIFAHIISMARAQRDELQQIV